MPVTMPGNVYLAEIAGGAAKSFDARKQEATTRPKSLPFITEVELAVGTAALDCAYPDIPGVAGRIWPSSSRVSRSLHASDRNDLRGAIG